MAIQTVKHHVKLWADYCAKRVVCYVIVNQVIKCKLTMGRLPESPWFSDYGILRNCKSFDGFSECGLLMGFERLNVSMVF